MNDKDIPKKIEFQEFSENVNSWNIAQRNGWAIKISTYNDENVMILFASQYTGQSMIMYCSNQEEAIKSIDYVTHKNAREILDLGY